MLATSRTLEFEGTTFSEPQPGILAIKKDSGRICYDATKTGDRIISFQNGLFPANKLRPLCFDAETERRVEVSDFIQGDFDTIRRIAPSTLSVIMQNVISQYGFAQYSQPDLAVLLAPPPGKALMGDRKLMTISPYIGQSGFSQAGVQFSSELAEYPFLTVYKSSPFFNASVNHWHANIAHFGDFPQVTPRQQWLSDPHTIFALEEFKYVEEIMHRNGSPALFRFLPGRTFGVVYMRYPFASECTASSPNQLPQILDFEKLPEYAHEILCLMMELGVAGLEGTSENLFIEVSNQNLLNTPQDYFNFYSCMCPVLTRNIFNHMVRDASYNPSFDDTGVYFDFWCNIKNSTR